MQFESEQLSLPKAILLHLLPGAVITIIFIILATVMRSTNMPALFWLVIAVPLGLIPTEFGYLLYLGKQRNGSYSLDGLLAYHPKDQPLTWTQYLWMVPATFVGMLILFGIMGAGDMIILEAVFGWWPAWLNIEQIDFGALPQSQFLPIVILTVIFANLVGPIIEEIYFRGYLLPRLSHFGRWANLLNTSLFALYHFWTPWHFIQRAIGSLPLAIAAKRGNLRVATITHVLVNMIGFTLTVLSMMAQ